MRTEVKRLQKKTILHKESDIVEFFKKYHKELSFEKILKIQTHFPDCLAVRQGKIVRIEFEYVTSRFAYHYRVFGDYHHSVDWQWGRIGDYWYLCDGKGRKIVDLMPKDLQPYYGPLKRLDKKNELTIIKHRYHLFFKTLVDKVDCIVCWEQDDKIEEGIEVITLKKVFARKS